MTSIIGGNVTRALLAGLVLALAACKGEPVTVKVSGETMGTTYHVTAIDQEGRISAALVKKAVNTALAEVNAGMSNWDPASEISQFNARTETTPAEISEELAHVMRAANQIHLQSEGLFDVTLGPLIELWGFGARTPDSPVPSDEDIAAALEVTGQTKLLSLRSSKGTMSKALPETSIYLAAIAKGYGVDRVAEALQELGLEDYMVEIGGDLVTAGLNPMGQKWRIGIERPAPGSQALEQIIGMSGLGMATSGDYRNYFEQDGVRYSHIIDGTTGRPITHNTASVTVLAESAMLADGWATALLALGQERGMSISERLGLAVLFITRDSTSGDDAFTSTPNAHFTALQASQ
jgi:thiamine biosynthesis lipoprotein